jgi:hypothetical protein
MLFAASRQGGDERSPLRLAPSPPEHSWLTLVRSRDWTRNGPAAFTAVAYNRRGVLRYARPGFTAALAGRLCFVGTVQISEVTSESPK